MARNYENELALRTQAITEVSGRPGDFHDVNLRWNKRLGGFALVIEDSPGQWMLNTLLGLDRWSSRPGHLASNKLAIDQGQRWYVTNLHQLLTEAVDLLQDLAHDAGRM